MLRNYCPNSSSFIQAENVIGLIYIGLKDVIGDDKNSSFIWVGDNSAMSFTNWNPNEPNQGLKQCTIMATSDGKWGEAFCTHWYGVVCETAVSHVNSFAKKTTMMISIMFVYTVHIS